jgi:hypothetical protein|tara:strand:+ start:4256 stop:6046 length:1791 start_codon:yes stop_codon:yes gene_type:complete
MPEAEASAALTPLIGALCAQIAGHELSQSELSAYPNRQILRGVTRQVQCYDGIDRHLDLLITLSFPDTLPLVAIRDPSLYLVWPHVESDGVICLPSAGKSYNGNDLLEQVVGVFHEALELVSNVASEAWRNAEFRKEFVTYWENHIQHRRPTIKAQISPAQRSCWLPYMSIGREIYVSDTDTGLREFAKRMTGKSVQKKPITQALLVKLPETPIPGEMPRTAQEAENLISRYAQELRPELETLIKSNKGLLMLVQAPQGNSVAYGGLWLPKNASSTSRRKSRQKLNGFRPGREPVDLLWRQYFSPGKRLTYLHMDRFDDVVVRSRVDQLSGGKDLAECHVALLGCGSVGSYIAATLAQSGIGSLTLIDPEILTSGNLSRHVLGARSVGSSKALDLAEKLLSDRPQLRSVTPIIGHAEKLSEKQWAQVMKADLVLFAIGQTGIENYAADMLWNKGFAGVIAHAWLEPFACVGHLLTCIKGGVARRQLTSALGDPTEPVSCWDGIEVEQEGGGCGGSYQPYGAAALSRSVAMMSAGIIDALLSPPTTTTEQVITGTTAELERHGGVWSTVWLAETNGHLSGRHFTQPHSVSLALASGE